MKPIEDIPMFTVGTGKGDGYMTCWVCGDRMSIKECAKNEYKGPTVAQGDRIIRWCNICVPELL